MLSAFHCNWTAPYLACNPGKPYQTEPFELLTTALSALLWRRENGTIRMICDSIAMRYYQALDLAFLWDDGIYPLLDEIPDNINPIPFWAGGKLFALAATPCPCVMIDTDFIVWKPLDPLINRSCLAVIHREDIVPDIYPDQYTFTESHGFDLSALDWRVKPCNTALCFFADDPFRRYYTDMSIRFMQSASQADNTLTYMVFAEQRLLSMCAAQKQVPITALSDLPALFNGEQQGYFTHIWGFKQQMRRDPALYSHFCLKSAARLQREFPQEAKRLSAAPSLAPYFSMIERGCYV